MGKDGGDLLLLLQHDLGFNGLILVLRSLEGV